jgi:DNA-binding NarL/FixJ family response regulator
MTNKKKMLIIEDREDQRLSLKNILESRGFEVYSAGNADEARQLAELHWDDLDVVILDMRLNDPNEPRTTGADIGIEFRKKKKTFPPESLIYSIENQIDYYRLALQLGAAAYLLKEVDNLLVVVQHAKVLALRRALNGENPKITAEVARIAVCSKSPSEAILTFCRRVLKPEFDSCLGAPFVILFTEGNTTRNCADNAGLPIGDSALYHTLQALAHGNGNLTDPFILETSKLEMATDQETALLHEKLNLAAFLPLSLSSNQRLSIGILHQEESKEVPVPTDNNALCKLLAQYLRPTMLENMMSIWSQWTELRATRTSTAKLCLSVGQEIKNSIETAELERLDDLADDLNDTGQLLIQLESRNWQDENDTLSVKEVVAAAWEWIVRDEGELTTKLDIQGDCSVRAQRSDLEIIISRLLQWFSYRSKATPVDVEPIIKIECAVSQGAATVLFEDNSYRLPQKLREDMFAPFTQAISIPFADIARTKPKVMGLDTEIAAKGHPNAGRYLPLYLAKMLVEGRYHGLLEDHSDEIKERSYGHRIILQLSGASKTA